jgi:hypothetical protein
MYRGSLPLLSRSKAASRRVARIHRHGSRAKGNVRPTLIEEPILMVLEHSNP